MHVHFLDPYRPLDSPIHRLDPRIKLVVILFFILTNALVPPSAWPVLIFLLALVLSAEVLSEVGITYVIKRSALALPFILAALPLFFTVPGEPLFSLHVGNWIIVGTIPGLERFLTIAAKSWVSVQAAVLLTATTSFPDLLTAMRALGVPRLLVSIFGLMWRYLFVFVDEATRLLRARAARSGQIDNPPAKAGGSVLWRARVAGGMAGNLFLRAFERSDRIYMAMVSRGYDGEARSLPLPSIRPAQWVILLASITLLLLIIISANLFWG